MCIVHPEMADCEDRQVSLADVTPNDIHILLIVALIVVSAKPWAQLVNQSEEHSSFFFYDHAIKMFEIFHTYTKSNVRAEEENDFSAQ